jgi:hypothetical protein
MTTLVGDLPLWPHHRSAFVAPLPPPIMLPLPLPALPMSQSTQRPVTTPSHRSHCAPYFSGQAGDSIEDFLCGNEELTNYCGLTDRQKVETVIRYTLPLVP